jgi:hypothetical protein
MVNNPEESQIERTRHYQWRLIMSITWRDLTIIQKISSKFRSKKIIYSETRGMCWHRFFWKKQVKRDKEKQSMKDRVQSANWRKRRAINKICRWLEEFDPNSGPVGRSDRPMANQKIDRWTWRRRYSRRYARWKARWRQINPRLTAGQESVFIRSLTLARVLFYFYSFFYRCK